MNTPTPYWFPLFDHMAREHGLTLTDSQLHEIALAAERCRQRESTEPSPCTNCGGTGWVTVDSMVRDHEGYVDFGPWTDICPYCLGITLAVEKCEEQPKPAAPSLRCTRWGCEDAALVWCWEGQWHKCFGGDRTIKVTGWYCPVCGSGYGDSDYRHSPNRNRPFPQSRP